MFGLSSVDRSSVLSIGRLALMARRLVKLLRNNSIAGVADALVTSGVMFAIQLALIWFGEKEEYGTYSLLMSYVLMGQAILSAIFGAPLITSASALPFVMRQAVLSRAVRWHVLGSFAIVLTAAPLLYFAMPDISPLAALLTLAAFIGLALRDIQRVIWAIECRLDQALVSSVAFGLIAGVIVLAVYLQAGKISLAAAMAGIAGAAILTVTGPLARRAGHRNEPVPLSKQSLASHARWTLPGVLVIWIQNNLYLTIVALLMTLSAVAEVSAARMVAMPYVIAAGALLRVTQVRLVQMLVDRGPAEALSVAKHWMALHLLVGATLALLTWIALQSGAQSLVGDKYPTLFALASLWFLFAGASSARGALSALYQAEGAYRQLFIGNLTTIPTALLGMIILIPLWGTIGAIVPLIAAELQFLLVLFVRLRKRQSEPAR